MTSMSKIGLLEQHEPESSPSSRKFEIQIKGEGKGSMTSKTMPRHCRVSHKLLTLICPCALEQDKSSSGPVARYLVTDSETWTPMIPLMVAHYRLITQEVKCVRIGVGVSDRVQRSAGKWKVAVQYVLYCTVWRLYSFLLSSRCKLRIHSLYAPGTVKLYLVRLATDSAPFQFSRRRGE